MSIKVLLEDTKQDYYTIDNNENSDYKLQGNIGSFINGKILINY